MPMIMSGPFREDLKIPDADIQWLYAAYSAPNLVTPIIFGLLLRNIGPKFIYVLLLVAISGQILFAVGVCYTKYYLMMIGRVLLGCGAESMYTSLNYLVKLYVPNQNILFMNSLIMALSRIGYSTSYYLNSQMYLVSKSFTHLMIIS